MVILTGETLGKRQQDLNKQVHEAVTRKYDFEKIKMEPNSSDLDVLFKINLASKCKNVDYVLDVLKSGDSLYISKAIKSTWLYDDEYSNIINVDYLHHNIFPSMSFKMKKKFLTTISMHVNNKDRAEAFYTYCTNMNLNKIAWKFLIFTSESFKIEVITMSYLSIEGDEELFFKNFVGNSFTLAKAIMENWEYSRSQMLFYLRYLISVSENEYLDMLEKYDSPERGHNRFGLRISTNVLKKHKSRLVQHPLLYIERLNKDLVTKYVDVEDAKGLVAQILPVNIEKFWRYNFCKQYDFLLKKIPAEEKFQFVKKIFEEKYPNKEFEMSQEFLNLNYYEFMTVDEREAWAVRHIENNTELQGVGRNYLWYAYVNFEKAFPEIKKIILKTPDFKERHNIVQVLVTSVRNLKDMKTLLTYYYDRHVNEAQYYKEQFVSAIIKNHNVFQLDNDCWAALNKLLHSMKVYNTSDTCGSRLVMYMAVMYHILHNIDLPRALKQYMLEHDSAYYLWERKVLDEKLTKEKLELIYQYIVKVYIDEITALGNVEHQDDNKIVPYVKRYVSFLEKHKKSSDDCPDVIMQFVKTNWSYFKHCSLFRKIEQAGPALTQAELMRQLKRNSKLVVDNLEEVKSEITTKYRCPPFQMNTFLKKIKVYFPENVTKEYLNYFMEILSEREDLSSGTICTVVYCIFQLADDKTKIEFMVKYAPTDAKIKHGEIDNRLQLIQEGICRSVCFSRPPVPLSNVLKYITGDYLHFCLPMFQSYQANLPQPLLLELASKLIEAPVSIQKHGLRLVFECFSIDNLKKTIYDSWKKTKNNSLRYVLYQSLCKKIRNEDENTKVELFEVLKKITADLKDDDNVDLYNAYMSDINFLPEKVHGAYIIICWQTVSKFPDKTENFRIKKIVIDNVTRCLHLLDGSAVKEIVEDHVKHMLVDKNIRTSYENRDLGYLYEAKWKLVATYIIYFSDIDFVKFIINKCVEMWHETNDNIFTYKKFCWQFIDDLIAISTNKCCEDAIPIFETILSLLKSRFTIVECYRAIWSLKLTILRRKANRAIKINYKNSKNPDLLALVRAAVRDYGTQAGKLVQENVDIKNYCVLMNDTVGEIIKDNLQDLIHVDIGNKGNSYYQNLKDVHILAAEGLSEVASVEANLLALYILPIESDCDGYAKILNKLKHFENLEVQTSWNNKFVYSDFKRRRLD